MSVLRERLFYDINQGFTCRSDAPPHSPTVEEAVVMVPGSVAVATVGALVQTVERPGILR